MAARVRLVINFRYHLVSIVAVFLAIAIGVVIGSTVIDSATVSVLEQQQESLDNRIEDVEAENDRLNAELDRYREREEQVTEQSAVLVDGLRRDHTHGGGGQLPDELNGELPAGHVGVDARQHHEPRAGRDERAEVTVGAFGRVEVDEPGFS